MTKQKYTSRKSFLSYLYSFIFLALFSFIFTPKAFAQQDPGLSLTLNPTVLELTESPGKKIEGKFRLRNNLRQPVTLSIKIDKLDARGQDGGVLPVTPEKGDTYVSWLKFDKQTFTAAPQEWTDVHYSIEIPKDAAFGYYYALRISQNPADFKTKTTTKVIGEIVVPLLLQIKREGAKREAKLVNFNTQQFINEYLPVRFLTTIENIGNVHLKPRGNIFIRGLGEKDLGIIEVNQGMGNILPGSKRTFESTWNDGFLVMESAPEDGESKPHLKINWNKITDFRFGKYTAKLVLVYDDGRRDIALESSKEFWVIPYTAIVVTSGGLIVLLAILKLILNAYIKQQIRRHQGKN